MIKNQGIIIILSTILLISLSCKNQQTNIIVDKQSNTQKNSVKALAKTIIYKTKTDYYSNVPVTLSEDKKDIISFPDIKDVYYKGQLAYPTRLVNGYLLDNRGIGKNVAFLKYTYEEYSKLTATPSKETLLNMIIDKNPLIEIYSCDKFDKSNIEEINNYIHQGLPSVCKNILN